MAVIQAAHFQKLNNPYTFGVPVRGEANFFGREEELQLIFNTLTNVPYGQKQDMAVVGPRRIGKSSLLYRLVDLLREDSDFIPAYLDIQFIKPQTTRNLFMEILSKIRQAYQQAGFPNKLPTFATLGSDFIPPDMAFFTFKADMENLSEAIVTYNLPRLVLMFDEVEVLLDFEGQSTLAWFRGLIQSMYYMVFVVAGSDRLYSLTQDYGSPFFNIFKIVPLSPLTDSGARQLVEEPAADIGMIISPDQVNKILRYAGNTPYFIQAITHHIVERLNQERRRHVQTPDLDVVLVQCVHNLSGHLSYFWNGVSQVQRIVLYTLAQNGRPQTPENLLAQLPKVVELLPTPTAQRELFQDLVQQQILQRLLDNRYWFVILLFADWINSDVDDEEILKLADTTTAPTELGITYNLGEISRLMTLTLSEEDILNLAYDRFRPVYDTLSARMSKERMVQQLVDYANQTVSLDKLLLEIKRQNPFAYASFEKELITFQWDTLPNDVQIIVTRPQIAAILERDFSLSEIENLVFALGISYEDLPGETRRDKARELIDYCHRHKRIGDLLERIRQERPFVNI